MQSNAQKQQNWWQSLSPAWQRAFNEVMLKSENNTEMPPALGRRRLYEDAFPSNAGGVAVLSPGFQPRERYDKVRSHENKPGAAYPNMSFELSDISGLLGLKQLQIVVIINQQLSDLGGINVLKNLKSLFVLDNRISNLDDLESMTQLEELYCQNNFIRSLLPLRAHTRLKTLYCSDNQLTSLEGIGEQHAGTLEKFVCLPNKGIPHPDIVRFELSIGIKCQRG